MEVYDRANALARAIKECKEYREYKEIKAEISKDPDLKQKVDEFEKIRYEEQLLAMQGEKQSDGKMQKLQELYKNNKEELENYTKILYSEARLIEGLPIDNPTEISNLICDIISK